MCQNKTTMSNQYKQFEDYLRKHYPFTKKIGSTPISYLTRVSFHGSRGFKAPVELHISAFSGWTKDEYKLLCVFHEDGTVVYDGVANQVVQKEDDVSGMMGVTAPTEIKNDYVGRLMKSQGSLTQEQIEVLFCFVKSEIDAAIPVWGPAYGIESTWA